MLLLNGFFLDYIKIFFDEFLCLRVQFLLYSVVLREIKLMLQVFFKFFIS